MSGPFSLELDADVRARHAVSAELRQRHAAAIFADEQIGRAPRADPLVLHGATAAVAGVDRLGHGVSPCSMM